PRGDTKKGIRGRSQRSGTSTTDECAPLGRADRSVRSSWPPGIRVDAPGLHSADRDGAPRSYRPPRKLHEAGGDDKGEEQGDPAARVAAEKVEGRAHGERPYRAHQRLDRIGGGADRAQAHAPEEVGP